MALIVFVYILEVVQIALYTADGYRIFARGWGNPIELDTLGLVWIDVPIFEGISE